MRNSVTLGELNDLLNMDTYSQTLYVNLVNLSDYVKVMNSRIKDMDDLCVKVEEIRRTIDGLKFGAKDQYIQRIGETKKRIIIQKKRLEDMRECVIKIMDEFNDLDYKLGKQTEATLGYHSNNPGYQVIHVTPNGGLIYAMSATPFAVGAVSGSYFLKSNPAAFSALGDYLDKFKEVVKSTIYKGKETIEQTKEKTKTIVDKVKSKIKNVWNRITGKTDDNNRDEGSSAQTSAPEPESVTTSFGSLKNNGTDTNPKWKLPYRFNQQDYSYNGLHIKDWGCGLAALAATESAYYNESIDPAKLAEKYNLPDVAMTTMAPRMGYTQEAFKSNDLSGKLATIYEHLKDGPVIIYGSRGSNKHWIVVDGYTGDGQSFKASDFSIQGVSKWDGYNTIEGFMTHNTLSSKDIFPDIVNIVYKNK